VELLTNVLAGIVGGLILNIMPCVLPVLAFKVQGWVMQTDISAAERRKDALAFLAGALVTFGVFAAVIISLRASGESIGWGMHMQNAPFVAFLIGLLFVFGLNAVGVFELSFAVQSSGPSEGLWASFSHGALITLVSTPCSAPVLGAATAAALGKDAVWYETLLLFWSIGFGLALPVIAVGFIPGAIKLIPRPGEWMNTFKLLVGFTLFGSAIWLFGTLQRQLSVTASNDFLWFLLCLSIAVWIFEKIRLGPSEGAGRVLRHTCLLAAVAVSGWVFLSFEPAPTPGASGPVDLAQATKNQETVPDNIDWILYSQDVRDQATKRNQPIFVDFTADWCASCKTFEKTHINVPSVRKVLAETGILAVKADLTKSDSKLWDVLGKLGRNGLPAYVIYFPDGSHDLMPEGPPLGLIDRLKDASKKFPKNKFKAN